MKNVSYIWVVKFFFYYFFVVIRYCSPLVCSVRPVSARDDKPQIITILMSTPYLEIAPPEVGFDAGVACVVPVETSVGLVAPETGDVPDDLAGVAIPGFVGLAVG